MIPVAAADVAVTNDAVAALFDAVDVAVMVVVMPAVVAVNVAVVVSFGGTLTMVVEYAHSTMATHPKSKRKHILLCGP